MAITKTVNKSPKTKQGLMNTINYVLQEEKVKDGYVCMTGLSGINSSEISSESVFNIFMENKTAWQKDNGRMCRHNIISFHEDEKITPEQALDFGYEFSKKYFQEFQCLVAVHQDKQHVHIHIITDTVNYITGKKLHQSKQDLKKMKELTNVMCIERGLTVAEKGKHFNGQRLTEGDVIIWNNNSYQLLANAKDSYLKDCGLAVLYAKQHATNKREFEELMYQKGWSTNWDDSRKYIVFKNSAGKKVRNSNINKHFSIRCGKEELLYEFKCNSRKYKRNEPGGVLGSTRAERNYDTEPAADNRHTQRRSYSNERKSSNFDERER